MINLIMYTIYFIRNRINPQLTQCRISAHYPLTENKRNERTNDCEEASHTSKKTRIVFSIPSTRATSNKSTRTTTTTINKLQEMRYKAHTKVRFLSSFLSPCLSLSICPSIYLSIYLSVWALNGVKNTRYANRKYAYETSLLFSCWWKNVQFDCFRTSTLQCFCDLIRAARWVNDMLNLRPEENQERKKWEYNKKRQVTSTHTNDN